MFSSATIEREKSAPVLKRPRSIQFWLRWLVFVGVLPAWAMTTWIIVASCERERNTREQATVDTARALVQAVDRELASSVVGLQTLATSSLLVARDLASFQRQAVEALPNLAGRNIILVDPSGQQLINTFRAFGNPLPRIEHGGQPSVEAVFRTGKPAISDLFVGNLTHQRLVAIGVPVILNGTVAYYLGMGISPESLDAILRHQNFSTEWVAGIVDSTGTFVARTHNGEQFIGKKAAPSLLRKIAEAREGLLAGDTQEGSSVVVGFSRSTVSNWAVGIAIPREELMTPLYQSLRLSISAAAALLLLALLIAWLISSRIARSIRALNESALALAQDAPFLVPKLEFREVNEIGGALVKASRLLKERRIAHAEAEQAERNLAVAKALARLNDAHRRLWRTENLKEGLDELLSATIEMLGADMGAIQLVDPTGKVVRIAAHQGLKQDVLDFFREVSAEDDTACGRALRTLTPVVIEDIELDPSYEPFRATGRAAGYRAVVSGPVVDRRGDLLGMLSVHFRAPHRPSDTELQWFDVCRRRTADFIGRCRSVQALRESEERLRLALEGGRIAIFDRDWRTGTFVWNDECYRLLGYKVGEVVPSRAAWLTRIHPDDRAAAETAFECTMRKRKDYSNEFRILHPNGSVCWVRSRGRYIYEAGEPIRLIGLIEDITEARQQVEVQRVLVAELQHRTRNLIAVVHAIAHQTLNTAASLKDFEQRFDHRLQALSRAQSLLSRADSEPITLGALIGMELEAIGSEGVGDRIRLTGPKVALSKRAVEMLALAVHELATNAVKYGALASENGQLSVTWEIVGTRPDRRVVLEWVEQGISVPVADDGQRGYGRTLIEQALPYSLSAQTKFELGTDALHCVISLPLATIDTNEAAG